MAYTKKAFILSAMFACIAGSAQFERDWHSYLYPNPWFPYPPRADDSQSDENSKFGTFSEILPQLNPNLSPLLLLPLPRGRPGRGPGPFPSCRNKCNIFGHNENAPCQCNPLCLDYGDCCPDYQRSCLSCVGRCFSKFVQRAPCQCNRQCERHQNCCEDFEDECGSKEGGVTDPELASLAEQLLSLDENNVAAHVSLDLQGTTSPRGPDNAPNPLLKLSPDSFKTLTMQKLVALHDNYIPGVGNSEIETILEKQEQADFLAAILSTPIMKRTEEFLVSKRLISSGSFRDRLAEIWFGMYSRQGNILGSSGFEHIFLGELKNGVSGFHNWVYFASEEANTNLNYNGYISTVSLNSKGLIVSHTFNWRGAKKTLGSMFVGTSPEFEMALYTVCWFSRPNAKCPVTLNGHRISIQTYGISYGGKKFVASAYPVIS